ncbi:MAG: hypothetical protein K2N55_03895 [Lachnospiraceae bacterium]|nr:hypothetical protein [Lachnospiraceae bacterium]
MKSVYCKQMFWYNDIIHKDTKDETDRGGVPLSVYFSKEAEEMKDRRYDEKDVTAWVKVSFFILM